MTGAPETMLRAAGCSPEVIAHCRAVCRCALSFTDAFPVDRDLLERGAILHDIGRSVTHGIDHAQAGADICLQMGCDEKIRKIVERHIGAGLTADECTLMRLVPRDCMPATLEEKIVANADNLVKGEKEISIQRRMLMAPHLPKRNRQRMFRLALEMELFR